MGLPTHALTLWRPWAWAIIHGPKRVENRTWKPPASFIGKRIGIHVFRQKNIAPRFRGALSEET